MAEKTKQRLSYIDWMRGLACLFMFQTHCYDSWLSEDARHSSFMGWSQLGGTLPAPLFLFLAGISSALVTSRLRQKGIAAGEIAGTTPRRGAEIFALGLLFRLQEFLLGWGWAPWTDLLRVDVLNIIGLSMVLMGAVCYAAEPHAHPSVEAAPGSTWRNFTSIAVSALMALVIALLTPPLWTTHRPRGLPWFLESYVNGVHIFGKPQTYLFPLFPWAAFAFAGLAAGFFLMGDWARRNEAKAIFSLGAVGAALWAFGLWLDTRPGQFYAVYDFWHSSPEFFFIRVGVVLLILTLSYSWCRWGLGERGFSPLIQVGTTSLLVYWVHIEFVYGRFSLLPKRMNSIPAATIGLATIFSAMLLLSLARTRWEKWRREEAPVMGHGRTRPC